MRTWKTCPKSLLRFLANPAIEMLAVVAVIAIALLSIAGAETFSRPHDASVAVFGPR